MLYCCMLELKIQRFAFIINYGFAKEGISFLAGTGTIRMF